MYGGPPGALEAPRGVGGHLGVSGVYWGLAGTVGTEIAWSKRE